MAPPKITQKDMDILAYLLLSDEPAYQKQISIEANVSERHLGDLYNKEGRLSILVKMGILERKSGPDLIKKGILDWCIWSKAPKRIITNFFYLKEDLNGFKQIVLTAIQKFANAEHLIYALKNSKYTQRIMENHVFNIVSKRFIGNFDLSQEVFNEEIAPMLLDDLFLLRHTLFAEIPQDINETIEDDPELRYIKFSCREKEPVCFF